MLKKIIIEQLRHPNVLQPGFDQFDHLSNNLCYFSTSSDLDYLEGYVCNYKEYYILFDLNDKLEGKDLAYKKNEATIFLNDELINIPYSIYDTLVDKSYEFERNVNDETIKYVLEDLLNYIN